MSDEIIEKIIKIHAKDSFDMAVKYHQLMADARALADTLRIASGASEVAGLRTLEDIIDKTLRDFDKKYPQLNEKE